MVDHKKLIVANWKMNSTLTESVAFVKALEINNPYKEIIICPSYPMIYSVKHNSDSRVKFGAQDCSENLSGSYTGDVSASSLFDIGCEYVIIGHSERRIHHNESIKIVKNKIISAIAANLKPIICIGEDIEIRNKGKYIKYIVEQIDILSLHEYNLNNIIIAYEPIWAIGSGKSANISQIKEIHDLIGEIFENKIKIAYGGSVNENNIEEILEIKNNSGALIGTASNNLKKFQQIIK